MSGTLKKTIPISLMIVSESGAGKSQTLTRFQTQYCYRADDLTSQGLFDLMESDKTNKIRFLLIPDFNPVLSHKPSVTNLLIANLLTLMSEGLVRVADGRQRKDVRHKPIGIITACTREMFLSSHKKFRALGIVRRIIPIHYAYSLETISAAQEAVREDRCRTNLLPPLKLPRQNGLEPVISDDYGMLIEAKSERLASNLSIHTQIQDRRRVWIHGAPMYPMAPHLILRTMARAHAKLCGRRKVTKDDLAFLDRFNQFANIETVTHL